MKETHKNSYLVTIAITLLTFFTLKFMNSAMIFSWLTIHTSGLLLAFTIIFLTGAVIFLHRYRKNFFSYQIKSALFLAIMSFGTMFLWIGHVI
ncbi:hypothetical protein [Enterococcus timonensis]|uniref:hypothetical protein n=1 Tax=Enterococcus timonensis TaxID=1852364 RepID=UPI0008D962D1|nr:hypothetical protein [Enterococcus timonensis]